MIKIRNISKRLKFTLAAVVIIGMLIAVFATPLSVIPEIKEGEIRSWKSMSFGALGDFDPGAGSGGFQRIVIKALPTGSDTNPNSNASVAVNLTDIDADGTSADIPHSIKFGIYIFARFNATQAYSVGNTTWVDGWTRCKITGVNISITASTVMNRTVVDTAGTTMLYVCFSLELNATAIPLMLARDQRLDLTDITLEAYY